MKKQLVSEKKEEAVTKIVEIGIKEERVQIEVPVLVLESDGQPVLDELNFEFVNKNTGEIVTTESTMGLLTEVPLYKDEPYIIRLKDNTRFTFNERVIIANEELETTDYESGQPLVELHLDKKEADKQVEENNKIKSLQVNIKKDNDNLKNVAMRLFWWDGKIPNVIDRYVTDDKGIIEIADLEANSKYELRTETTTYKYDRDSIIFTTDEDGNIVTLDGTTNVNGVVEINAYDKKTDELKKAQVMFKVVEKTTGLPLENVEFTANTLQPRLSSYKNVMSDKDGNVIFNLEGQPNGKIYTICVAKNAQFLWDFEPEEITLSIDENSKITYNKETDKIFKVTKNDRRYLKDDLVNKIKEAEKVAENNANSTYLKTIINSSKEELAKPETIPFYVEGFIKSLTNEMKKLESIDKVVEISDELLKKVINKNIDKNRTDNQDIKLSELERLEKLSLFLDKDGKASFDENAKYDILGTPKSLSGTNDFKFAVTRGIKNLSGLEYAKNLKYLKLNENEIKDISVLEKLTNLEYIELQRNRIKDITPLANLTNLKFLKLYNNLIEDVSSISKLTNLESLDLHYNVTVEGDENNKIISKGITNIFSLANLTNLKFLDVSANRIEDISVLNNLTNIEDLDFSGNRVRSYANLDEYIAPRLQKMLMEGEGSIAFAGQNINSSQTVNVESAKVEFPSDYVGLNNISTKLSEIFGEDVNLYSNLRSSIPGIKLDYDKETNKIIATIDENVRKENQGKTLSMDINFGLDAYMWKIKNVQLVFPSIELPQISNVSLDKNSVKEGEGVVATIFGKKLTNDVKLLVKEIVNGEEIVSADIVLQSVEGEKSAKKTANLVIKNKNTEDKKYRLYFYYGDKETLENFADLTVTAEKKMTATIEEISTRQRSIKAKGGTLLVNVKGSNLVKDTITFDIYKNNSKVDDVSYSVQSETANDIEYLFTIPANSGEESEYKIVARENGDIVKVPSLKVKQKGQESGNLDKGFTSSAAYFSEDYKKISIVFPENVINAKDSIESLKKTITISRGKSNQNFSPYVKLSAEDKVSIEGNSVVVTLKEGASKEDAPLYRIKMTEGAVKNASNKYSDEVSWLIKSPKQAKQSKITNYDIKNAVLNSDGGVVEVVIVGENLKVGTSKIRIFDANDTKENKTLSDKIDYEISGQNLIAKIHLPENTSSDAKSYKLSFIHEGDKVFNRYLEAGSNRGDRPVVTVLAKNQAIDKPILSNMTITSYATSSTGNADEVLNNTHTITAKGQNSKKTEVRLYGANLNELVTKVKIIDENGVEWPIFSAGSSLSGTYPKMILPGNSKVGNGLVGNGTFQIAEIILPENLATDMTYSYYFAVDGENFDMTKKVTALVEKTSGNVDATKRVLTVNFVDEEGRSLKDSKEIYGYSWFNYDFSKEQIKGYTLKDSASNKGTFGTEDKTINLVFEKNNKVLLATKEDKDALTKEIGIRLSTNEEFKVANIEDKANYTKLRTEARELVMKDDASHNEVLAMTEKLTTTRESMLFGGAQNIALDKLNELSNLGDEKSNFVTQIKTATTREQLAKVLEDAKNFKEATNEDMEVTSFSATKTTVNEEMELVVTGKNLNVDKISFTFKKNNIKENLTYTIKEQSKDKIVCSVDVSSGKNNDSYKAILKVDNAPAKVGSVTVTIKK